MSETIDEKCQILLKDAFKRYLREQLGPIEDKPIPELQAWNLALIEVASAVRLRQLYLEEVAIASQD